MDIIAVLMQATVFVLLSFSKYAAHKVDPNQTGSEASAQTAPNATSDGGGGGGLILGVSVANKEKTGGVAV